MVYYNNFYNPVTLAGRFVFVGPDYYLSVMGYDISKRQNDLKRFYEAKNPELIDTIKRKGITYVEIYKNSSVDFPYEINWPF